MIYPDNTLSPYEVCPNSFINYAGPYINTWESIYLADAVKRLQPYVGGLNLTTSLLADMQQLCAYEVNICNAVSGLSDANSHLYFTDYVFGLLGFLLSLHEARVDAV
jgi:hypothetical protein